MKTTTSPPYLLSFLGAPEITLDDIIHINEKIGLLACLGVMVIIAFAIFEIISQWREKNRTHHDHKESISSFVTGMGALTSAYLTKALLLSAIIWCYNLIPWRQEFHWWLFIPCYIIHDFISYWRHRVTHHSRFWWSIHIPHHSANHYNIWINFRQSWFEQLCVVFYIPLFLLGFHPVLYIVVHQLSGILQLGLHTEYIGKLPRWIEYIFVTPTSHKVHHASNEKYLDKNFGNTFIIWDRIFGTFQELDEKPVYGLTVPVYTNNIFHIVFDEAMGILKDIKKSKSWKEKIWMSFGRPSKIAAHKKMQLHTNIKTNKIIYDYPSAVEDNRVIRDSASDYSITYNIIPSSIQNVSSIDRRYAGKQIYDYVEGNGVGGGYRAQPLAV